MRQLMRERVGDPEKDTIPEGILAKSKANRVSDKVSPPWTSWWRR